MSSVFRVIKNCNYTTLSNYHFKDRRLSWKAKGLLSTMLSLPDDWNYTVEGLASLSDDGIKATNSGLNELEEYGYLIRKQIRDDNGHFGVAEYTIYEQPVVPDMGKDSEEGQKEHFEPENKMDDQISQPSCQNGQTAENTAFPPYVQNRQTEKRISEKDMQLNTNILNTKKLSTYSSSSEDSEQVQNRMRQKLISDEQEEEDKLKKHFHLEQIAKKCSFGLVEAVFKELCKRDKEFIRIMNTAALEQVCLAVDKKQKGEPIRMLANLINTYLDNIMIGIKASGSGGGRTPPQEGLRNGFYDFMQNEYDFDALEKELIRN